MTFEELLSEFSKTLRVRFRPSTVLGGEVESLLNHLSSVTPLTPRERRSVLLTHVNRKFRLNAEALRHVFAYAAHAGVTFNYHEKLDLATAYDSSDRGRLQDLLERHAVAQGRPVLCEELLRRFDPTDEETTIRVLHSELRQPTLVRKDSKPRDWSCEILSSLFGAFVYSAFPEPVLHAVNDPLTRSQQYEPDFWTHLHKNFPHLFTRGNALTVLRVVQPSGTWSFDALKLDVLSTVSRIHEALANHGYLAILVGPLRSGSDDLRWQLFGHVVLYAEKHIAERVDQQFFRPAVIQDATTSHIHGLDVESAAFEQLNHGFRYQDCFVIGTGEDQELLLLFQKNQADETLIPCPACRSHNVEGNSYSSMGVRSWECRNQVCPDRSKFNRGKRYSFLQLLKQRAIGDPDNVIPVESVRGWARDVQPERSSRVILEMLLRHYSLSGDSIWLCDWDTDDLPDQDRRIVKKTSRDVRSQFMPNEHAINEARFVNAALFHRYVVERPQSSHAFRRKDVGEGIIAFSGDSFEVLSTLEEASVDGAVTSPPYFNAREYSQWENIYTYLYDMYNVNRHVFRVMRPGANYLFNIFDYFDNEKTVSLSAMGQKRMILGAYVLDLFARIGFQCVGNIVWDKGEIEGKRAFNNGNFSPYYQAPFNCWEHIFVFRKPADKVEWSPRFPDLIQQKPVIKMIRGQNRHGHSAPFPEAIPRLLCSTLPSGALVLDPFAGSMTTGLVAAQFGQRAVCIEKDEAYFNLGVRRLEDSLAQKVLI